MFKGSGHDRRNQIEVAGGTGAGMLLGWIDWRRTRCVNRRRHRRWSDQHPLARPAPVRGATFRNAVDDGIEPPNDDVNNGGWGGTVERAVLGSRNLKNFSPGALLRVFYFRKPLFNVTTSQPLSTSTSTPLLPEDEVRSILPGAKHPQEGGSAKDSSEVEYDSLETLPLALIFRQQVRPPAR